jgi:hypothetical protein
MPFPNCFPSLFRRGVLLALAILLSAAFPGGLQAEEPVTAPPSLRAETVGAPGFTITGVQLSRAGERLRVWGGIRRHGFGSGYGHVDIELLDQGGRVLSTRDASYLPNPIPMTHRGWDGRSEFCVRFDRLPPGVAIVRVRFHPKD